MEEVNESLAVLADKQLATLDLKDLTKADINNKVAIIGEAIAEGHFSAVDALCFAKKLEELAKQLGAVSKDYAADELSLGKNQKYDRFSVSITERNNVRYDYGSTGDAQWIKMNEEVETLKAEIKARETFLKSVTKPMTIVDEDSGSIETINPPIQKGGLALVCSLK